MSCCCILCRWTVLHMLLCCIVAMWACVLATMYNTVSQLDKVWNSMFQFHDDGDDGDAAAAADHHHSYHDYHHHHHHHHLSCHHHHHHHHYVICISETRPYGSNVQKRMAAMFSSRQCLCVCSPDQRLFAVATLDTTVRVFFVDTLKVIQ